MNDPAPSFALQFQYGRTVFTSLVGGIVSTAVLSTYVYRFSLFLVRFSEAIRNCHGAALITLLLGVGIVGIVLSLCILAFLLCGLLWSIRIFAMRRVRLEFYEGQRNKIALGYHAYPIESLRIAHDRFPRAIKIAVRKRVAYAFLPSWLFRKDEFRRLLGLIEAKNRR